ncbi:MAG: ABC transporter ATP-binding protein [Chloroherpetonaceae bacterium]|nr:ABC transporter ATP-binding protein [Chloroherpetonaceae bacterium]MCS7211661.1 ABC transporter ATP-binding protein [Chloroherpetonaceae bacterium]MDW8018557.1 ABC transporter ATP-binding protein [Chloroherpetonaceae bacterium]MDW8467343.1 ABC transporter ATP-binding protein [Chloroherpetonaceae bacterium]
MIEIKNLKKAFRNKRVLQGVTLDIQTGETMVIIGRSGCGKSVLLKHIVGLLMPDDGEVRVDGKVISQLSKAELYKLRLRFGFLFQGAALFDSMTVGENVGIALRENTSLSEKEIRKIVAEKLEMVGLPNIEHLKPAELSGGMRKRVGLARALATNPEYIFYDEPTTGLDPIMSDSIDTLIQTLAKTLRVTSVVVTHDMQSVYKVADRVAMMHEGKIYFLGSPSDLAATQDPIIRNFVDRNSYHDVEIEDELGRLSRQQKAS